MDVHEKIKVMRLFKDLTQEEMAEKLGYSSVHGYAKLERGETEPTISRLEQVAKVLGVSLQNLLGLSDSNVVNIAGNCHHNYGSQNIILTETECVHELEQTRLLLLERDKEVEHLKTENGLLREVVELMKIQPKTHE